MTVMFKITSTANDSLSTLGSVVLLISLEDQICLDSIPGWEPKSSEDENIVPSVAPSKRTPTGSKHSKDVGKQHAITNGLDIERVRRKILVDDVDELVPRKKVSCGASRDGHVKSPEHESWCSRKADVSSSKRPRSLPDVTNYVSNEHHGIDGVMLLNGKESVAKEDRRLKSLTLVTRKSLQKNSPVSRSLNSISDINITSRCGEQVDVLRNRSGQLHSPVQTSGSSANVPDKQCSAVPAKRSCVRRLNLDGGMSPSQSSVKNLYPSVERQIESVLSSEQPATDKVTSKLSLKKRQLNSQNNDRKLTGNRHTSKKSTASKSFPFSQSRNTPYIPKDLPEGSEQYKIGPETQQVLMNNFGDDSFCISEKPKGNSNEGSTSLRSAGFELSGNACKDKNSEITNEADNLQTSEELFSGSQDSMCGDHRGRDKTQQQSELGSSQRSESVYYSLKHLSSLANVVHKSHTPSQQIVFTKSQLKSMCKVISRLYSSPE